MVDTEIKTVLVEDTVGANDPNIETTDEKLSIDEMFQQSSLPSLGRQIFSVQQMHGPTAALFNIRKKTGTNDFELVRKDVEVFPCSAIKTGITQEAIQDARAQFGKEAENIIGNLLKGLTNDVENTETLTFLNAKSAAYANLQLTDSLNAETNLFELTQRVHELVLKINSKNLRSYEAFAVIPFQALGGIMGLSQYVGADDKNERGLFIAKVGKTRFYMNPDATSTTAYVGLKDSTNSSKSSAVFSPYATTISPAVDPDTGSETYNIFNRFAITESPLHETGNEMLYKFTVLL